MPRRRVRAALLLICLSALDFSGCFVRRRIITRKGASATPVLLTADKQTLIDRLAQQYRAVQSFSATVDMTPALGSSEKSKITEYKDVRGYILFRKPADIRIIGLYPVVRNKAFDMVSNGKDFRLYLPSQNRFVVGSNELVAPSKNKIENLRPQHFLEALMVAPIEAHEKSILVNLTDEDNAVVHFAPCGDAGEWADPGSSQHLVQPHQSAYRPPVCLRRGRQYPDRCPLQRLAELRWRAVSEDHRYHPSARRLRRCPDGGEDGDQPRRFRRQIHAGAA